MRIRQRIPAAVPILLALLGTGCGHRVPNPYVTPVYPEAPYGLEATLHTGDGGGLTGGYRRRRAPDPPNHNDIDRQPAMRHKLRGR